MNIIDIIVKKRDGGVLTEAEIEFFIQGTVDQTIPDYQVSALLMAIYCRGMNAEETYWLTKAMMYSGEVLDLQAIPGLKVDKHSTGGVGDKTSLALTPILAACGLKVAKMSGRGLAHTGGTLDKLESIPGFSVSLTGDTFRQQISDLNLAIIGQSQKMVPADKILYALRDVTGTVPSVPLIASSIMSKKLAAGADTILLDVKYGIGAFMPNKQVAEELAIAMIKIGQSFGKKVIACLNNMNPPLGLAVGNLLEVLEARDTLLGKGPIIFTDLCLYEAALMLKATALVSSVEEGIEMARTKIADGSAYRVFCRWIEAQGGDASQIGHLEQLLEGTNTTPVVSVTSGYVHNINSYYCGMLVMELGGGRRQVTDVIDPYCGVVIEKPVGSKVEIGDTLMTIYHTKELSPDLYQKALNLIEVKTEVAKMHKYHGEMVVTQ